MSKAKVEFLRYSSNKKTGFDIWIGKVCIGFRWGKIWNGPRGPFFLYPPKSIQIDMDDARWLLAKLRSKEYKF